MLERLEILIGNENVNKIKEKNILVIGLGGVGGYVVESLIRCGIENIVLVDFDKIDETNLNRQIIATRSNINKKKTDAFYERIMDINDKVKVIKIDKFIDESNYKELFDYKIDYLIDCCDYIMTKKLLIKECLDRKIKFITSMGTGYKLDPSKLEITDIRKTSYDKIAKILRKWVKDENIKGKITCVSSTEKPIINKETKKMGSNSFVPASAGLLITSYVIRDIIK